MVLSVFVAVSQVFFEPRLKCVCPVLSAILALLAQPIHSTGIECNWLDFWHECQSISALAMLDWYCDAEIDWHSGPLSY